MKKLLAVLSFLSCFSLFGQVSSRTVYICTGSSAYAYHSRSDCSELSNCGYSVIAVTEYDAQYLYGKKPCCKCWTNVPCNDDPAPVYSAGQAQAMGYLVIGVAAGIITGGIFIISNDAYCYPVLSFYDRPGGWSNPEFKHGAGWSFGLRKTFDYSAIEYGLHYIRYPYYQQGIERSVRDWGGRVTFVHDVFFDKTPDNIRFYLGPTINVFKKLGYGGVVGLGIRIADRFKIDFRYEITTQTNQLQIGLIFTYQKHYFWKKNKSDFSEQE